MKTKTEEEIKGFEDLLMKKYGFRRYLYATSEGLPIMGNFEGYEELSAKTPELFKALKDLEHSDKYFITGTTSGYLLLRVSPEVILLAEAPKEPSPSEIQELIEKTREELGI